MTRISFVMPTKNRPRQLNTALDYLSRIKGDDDELIVVDGASGKEVDDVVSKYDGLVDHYLSRPDTCIAQALNDGIRIAKGKYVRLEHDDDKTYAQGLEHAYSVMENNPDIDLLISGGIKERKNVRYIAYVHPGTDYGSTPISILLYGACGTGFLIRRTLLEEISFDEAATFPDQDFALACQKAGKVVRFSRNILYYHPITPESLVYNKKKLKPQMKALREKYGVTLEMITKAKRAIDWSPVGLRAFDGGLS